MYYILWFVGVLAASMLAVVTGLWIEHTNGDQESQNK
ncbi:cytochrome bd oxidase small subunit, CydX/CbdX family [Gilliamella apicola]